jgi:ankyrin repeat protein
MSIPPPIDRLLSKLLCSSSSFESEIEAYDYDLERVGTLGRTPLMVAASEGLEAALDVLVRKGAKATTAGDRLMTPLHEASANGHTRIVVRLVELGANVNAETQDGVTPLMCAAAWGHLESAKTLLALGADCTKLDSTGATALDIAREKGEDEVAEMMESYLGPSGIFMGKGVNRRSRSR